MKNLAIDEEAILLQAKKKDKDADKEDGEKYVNEGGADDVDKEDADEDPAADTDAETI